MSNKKILITGGAGFIGYHLCRRLAKEGHEITICDNFSRGKLDNDLKTLLESYDNCKLLECDLANKDEVKKLGRGYDYIYDAAAIVSVKYANEIPEKVLKANILSTINILDWFVETGNGRILFSSTGEVYAGSAKCYNLPIPTPENVPLTIEDVFNPRYSYAGSKILGELLFINYARAYGIDMRIVRYHNIYGPRMGFQHVIPELSMRILRRENPCKIYGTNQTRAFCYVDDAIEATIRLMASEKARAEIINIGNDKEEILISALAQKLFEIGNFHPTIEPLPAPGGSTERRCPNIDKLRKLTGFDPAISLREGLLETFDWYRKHFEATSNVSQQRGM
jgi:UDP-glucose 4-epimerase/UDP-glucuronate decarboxylase